jgi:Common central domain of tyrosinase
MNIRKSVNSLSASEKAEYINGVLLLKANGTYETMVQIHVDNAHHAHSGPAFLPWHREYLLRYERALQNVLGNPNFALPYWDWAVDAALPDPTTAPIWLPNFLGGDGTPVTTGAFANWPITDVNIGLTSLYRTLGLRIDNLPTQSQVDNVMNITPYDSSPWDRTPTNSFRNQLEGWVGPNIHNRVHVWVGGAMLPMSSPNDPVFWLHHCNVDRLWALWQCQNPQEGYKPTSGGPSGHSLNDNMAPWDTGSDLVKPADVLDIFALGYSYDLMDSTNGDLLHTIRFNNNTWQRSLYNVEKQSGERGIFVDADCAGAGNKLHVCGVTNDGHLWHTFRSHSGNWQNGFGDIENQSGNQGLFAKVACGGIGSRLHVCGITSDGRLWHTSRNGTTGGWQNFTDVESHSGQVGDFADVACCGVGNNLHICATTTDGRILHTIRFSNGNWQSTFGNIENQTGESGTFATVGCAGVGDKLHVCAVTNTGRLLHTLRNNNGTWQNFFGDIEALTGEAGVFTRVACTGKGSELHVCGVNSNGQILHTIRFGNNSWQPFFGDIGGQLCRSGQFQGISCGVEGNDVHVCIIT